VRERFEQKLAEYEAASRKLAESRGLIRAPHKYSPKNLDRFMLYQFAALSSKKIADRLNPESYGTPESGILKGA
jgi:hypothetical protein